MNTQTMRMTQGRGRLYDSILGTIGDTLAIRVNTLAPADIEIFERAETFSGSRPSRQ